MGGLCSVSISVENTLSFCCNHAAKHASYAYRAGKNMDVLEAEMEELKALRNDVKRRIEIAERQHMKRLDQVEWWLSRVEVLEGQIDEVIRKNVQETNCPRCCTPRHFWSSYKAGKRAAKILKMAIRHRKKGNFERVAEILPLPPGDLRPCEHTVGMESMIKTVSNCLREEQAGIIGLYGMGGIGKTTLLTQINNMILTHPSNVDFVIWAVASKDFRLEKIQEEIGEKIGYSDNRWSNRSIEQKAADIYRVLSSKKFVLLLDDLWDRVDLTKVGVPIPDHQNNSKLIFTTRSKEVCGLMEAHKIFKVECLPEPFAWHLFQKKVGNDTLNQHPDISDLAEIVAKECDGLPLALVTVGRAMACKKTPQEWMRAIEVLRKCASEFSGMGDKVFPLLKFSFEHLPNEKVRSCFLYCILFPEDFVIQKADLIDYWICEGLLDECNDRNEAQNQGYEIIGILVYACLLEEEEEGDSVKMHDVIRDMAMWIANECKNSEESVLVQSGVRLIAAPEIRKWEAVKRISLMENRLESLIETPSCPHLLTLFLNHNTLKTIANDFFKSMPDLKVLDLSGNSGITELPLGISKLVSLRYLNLSKTSITQLPDDLKSLDKLKHLNLEDTFALNKIPCQLISSFSYLQVLRMLRCGSSDLIVQGNILSGGNECLVEELQCLKKLSMLSLTVKSASALERFLGSYQFKNCTQDLCLQFLSDSNVLNISCLVEMKQLNMLDICDCKTLEELKHDMLLEQSKPFIPVNFHSSLILSGCFNGLKIVNVDNCIKLKDLTWLMLAPNLASLCVSRCSQMKEIICTEKCRGLAEVVRSIKPFEKLEVLHLSLLYELKCIYQDPLLFPSLKKIFIFGCPKLKKLPISEKSTKGHGIAIHGWEFWWKALEWEDETTKNAFSPCFKPRPLNISLLQLTR